MENPLVSPGTRASPSSVASAAHDSTGSATPWSMADPVALPRTASNGVPPRPPAGQSKFPSAVISVDMASPKVKAGSVR